MSAELQSHLQPESIEILDEWRGALEELTAEVREWCAGRGWRVEEQMVSLVEEHLGAYSLPRLVIHRENPVILEPVARFVMGAEGRVDLYSYPSMDRVMLLRSDGRWVIRPELGPSWPLPWSEEAFVDLVERLSSGR